MNRFTQWLTKRIDRLDKEKCAILILRQEIDRVMRLVFIEYQLIILNWVRRKL